MYTFDLKFCFHSRLDIRINVLLLGSFLILLIFSPKLEGQCTPTYYRFSDMSYG